jgi:hypothetical protein
MPWQDYRFAVPEGMNVLEWRYRKDANFSAGDDGAFIDDIYLPLAESSIAPRLAVVQLPGGEIEIQLSGLPGRLYRIDASADFGEWTTVHSASTPDGTLRWVEPEASAYSRRYYRAAGL